MFDNMVESICSFFDHRKKGGLLDFISEKIGFMGMFLIQRPNLVKTYTMTIGTTLYKVETFGGHHSHGWEAVPTIRVARFINNDTSRTKDILSIEFAEEKDAALWYINNYPVDVIKVKTRNQLCRHFGWTDRELLEFFDQEIKHSVEYL